MYDWLMAEKHGPGCSQPCDEVVGSMQYTCRHSMPVMHYPGARSASTRHERLLAL